MPFAGFDVSKCPPMNAMQWLWDHTNLYWVGFYLPVGGIGYEDKKTFKKKFAPLRNIGWGIAPLYVGKQRNSVKLSLKRGKEREEGRLDGIEAADLAFAEGIPLSYVIYFDYEGGDAPTKAWKQYYFGWVEAVTAKLYYPGLYISYKLATTSFLNEIVANTGLFGVFGRPEILGVRIDAPGKSKNHAVFDVPKDGSVMNFPEHEPADCGAAEASSWQHSWFCTVNWMDETNPKRPIKKSMRPVDLDTSSYANPGQAANPIIL